MNRNLFIFMSVRNLSKLKTIQKKTCFIFIVETQPTLYKDSLSYSDNIKKNVLFYCYLYDNANHK